MPQLSPAPLSEQPAPPAADETVRALSDEQNAARTSNSALTVIRAGAGTGKTTTLLSRLAWLVERGVRPGNIIVTTFTRQACRDMRKKMLAAYPETDGVRVQTLHALAARIFRFSRAEAEKSGHRYAIIDKADALPILKEAISEHGGTGLPTADFLLNLFCQARESGSWVLNLRDIPTDNKRDAVLDIYQGYKQKLRGLGLVELSDIIPAAVKAMQRPEIAGKLKYIKHILVDEWQDTSPAQIEMVRIISAAGADVTIVGDDDQSIYSFRGAEPRLVERAPDLLPEVAGRGFGCYRLTQNRRNTQEILAPAVKIANKNRRDEPKALSSKTSGKPVSVLLYRSDHKEARAICDEVEAAALAGKRAGDFAVLARTKAIVSTITDEMTKRGVPFSTTAITPLAERAEIRDILAYIRLAILHNGGHFLARIGAKPKRGLGEVAISSIVAISKSQGLSTRDALVAYANNGATKRAREGALELADHLNEIATAVENGENSSDIIDFILNNIGYGQWAKDNSASKNHAKTMASLKEMCAENAEIPHLMDAILTSSDSGRVDPDSVYVGTLHGAKGMEWHHVFMVGMEQDIFPHARAVSSGVGAIEEERRLAHVGMTRASKTLTLTCAKARSLGGEIHFMRPSVFIREAGLSIVEAE